MGLDAYIAIGRLPGGITQHVWVVTREANGDVRLWETTKGRYYTLPQRWKVRACLDRTLLGLTLRPNPGPNPTPNPTPGPNQGLFMDGADVGTLKEGVVARDTPQPKAKEAHLHKRAKQKGGGATPTPTPTPIPNPDPSPNPNPNPNPNPRSNP